MFTNAMNMSQTNTIFSDTPAFANGSTCAQIFVGTKSLVTDAYGIKSDGKFVATLEDNIRERGAMSKLISDCAKAQVSNKALDILRNYVIDDWQSEPYHEHQNPAERRYQTVKQYTNDILDKSGAPSKAWLLALLYAVYLLNHLATDSLGGYNPLSVLTGLTTDVSILLMFSFWEPIYFPTGNALLYAHKPGFPSETAEQKGRFVGFGESVGDALTFKIITDDTQKILYQSTICSYLKHNRMRFWDGPTGINALNPLARLLSRQTTSILLRHQRSFAFLHGISQTVPNNI